ncbi:MAG: hypothetical protein ACOCTT_03125, partial [archaeon]
MKIEINREKCIEGCSLCLEACPEITEKTLKSYKRYDQKEKMFEIFESTNIDVEIIDKCPENAFEETETKKIYRIKKEKCRNCGACVKESNQAIIQGIEKPIKCTLCSNQEEYRCIEACPYNALKLVYTDKEKKELKEKIGYQINREKETEEIYEVKEENYNIQETRVIDEVLKKIREEDRSTEKEEIEAAVEKKCLEMNIEINENHVEKLSRHINREINGLS